MPTRPNDPATTFNGFAGLVAMSSGNHIADEIINKLQSGSGGIFKSISVWIINGLRDAFNSVIAFLSPGATGAFAYLQSDPSWLETLAQSTSNSLWQHRSRILWIQYTYVRQVQLSLEASIVQRYNELVSSILSYFYSAQHYTDGKFNQLLNILNGQVALLNQSINALHAWALQNINYVYAHSIAYTQQQAKDLLDKINYVYSQSTKYTDKQVGSLSTKVIAGFAAATAALAAAVSFITDVEIPGAIEAAILALNVEAAASMAVQWEYIATKGNAAIIQLGLADLDPLWATDVLSEIPPTSIAAANADIASALKLMVDYLDRAGVPLYRKLHSFADDIAGLGSVVTTVIVGGIAVAGLADPEDTATVLADVLADPLNTALTGVLDLVGL